MKPCPFCGKGRTTIREHNIWTGKRYIVSTVTLMHFCEGDRLRRLISIPGKTEEEVIEKWNTRYDG